MNLGVLARRSVQFYFRAHLGTVAGVAIATAVLTGALLVGDSVRGSLREMALARLGKIGFALASGDRLFRFALADEMQRESSGVEVIPALIVSGTASTPDGGARANQVQVIGADDRFFKLARQAPAAILPESGVWINTRLAQQLKVRSGDTVVLRVPRISHLSRDAPLAPEEDATVALRLEVQRVLSDGEFGRFGLAASQIPPLNAFLSAKVLQPKINATNQANLLLVGDERFGADELNANLQRAFTLADAQLSLRELTNRNEVELRSSRVFLDDAVSAAALKASDAAQPVLTYFVNQLRVGDKATPYSMVAGLKDVIPSDMRDDEAIINDWLAEDLGAKPGDQLKLTYFVMGLMRELVQKTNTFRIRQIVPISGQYADPSLMPDFPGMTDAQNCRDWDTGFPINTDAIRDKDEDYWHKHRGTPKAFVTLAAAQQMWTNRFGNLTAVRYPNHPGEAERIAATIKKELPARALGFVFQPVREQALTASAGAQDFGGLFIGFSFFLIAAALILISLLFRFALEQRGVEIGTLLAIGFAPKKVRRLLLLEALVLSVIGGVVGCGAAVLYARAMLYGLSTIWSDAVAGASLSYHASAETLLYGFSAGVIVALLTIWWSLRRELKRTARELLSEGFTEAPPSSKVRRASRLTPVFGTLVLATGLATAGYGFALHSEATADLFFSAGSLILVGALMLVSAFIRRLEFSSAAEHLSLAGMGVRNIARRRRRSRAAVALLACGSFLIASIGAFRLDSGKAAQARSSGTGGFALIGESSLPVVHNLNTKAGRDFYGLGEKNLEAVEFVPFRVLQGEDASCLNLNRAQRPRLLGVNPTLLHTRRAFTFTGTIDGKSKGNEWLLLDQDFGPNVVPAIGDAASIQWALGKKLGDSLTYLDQNGREFQIRIVASVANSILQGSLVISERNFVRRFPTEAGYRMFLIDAPSNGAKPVAATLMKAMQDAGLEVTSAAERLGAFNAVQNTYLGTFQMLGGLGLLLGTFGLGIILLRNVFERRSELALLLAVGFRRPALRWLVLSEHAALLGIGLLVGAMAAAVAVAPALIAPGRQLPYLQLGLTLGAVLVCGLIWTAVAAAKALRAPLLKSLQSE